MEKKVKKKFPAIENLVNALRAIGIHAEIDYSAEWYCYDNKTHYGIEITTNMDYGEDCWSFIFTPSGRYVESCLSCPVKK